MFCEMGHCPVSVDPRLNALPSLERREERVDQPVQVGAAFGDSVGAERVRALSIGVDLGNRA